MFLFFVYLAGAIGWFLLALGYWPATPFIVTCAFGFCCLDMIVAAIKKLVGAD